MLKILAVFLICVLSAVPVFAEEAGRGYSSLETQEAHPVVFSGADWDRILEALCPEDADCLIENQAAMRCAPTQGGMSCD